MCVCVCVCANADCDARFEEICMLLPFDSWKSTRCDYILGDYCVGARCHLTSMIISILGGTPDGRDRTCQGFLGW